jgi:RNA-directed DNA polymerase
MEQVVHKANMTKAWKRVRSNKGAPGLDGVTVEAYPEIARETWPQVKADLLNGHYQPQPVRRVSIPKPSGGLRELGIPTVQDRLIQQALLLVLTPIFDPTFSESSFGFRPGRSAHGAVKQVKAFALDGAKYAVDLDLEKFFDRVQHDVLIQLLALRITDRRVLRLIGRFLRAGMVLDGYVVARREGTPQGGPLSPLLANVLLDELDRELESRGVRFARYADDVLIAVKSLRAGHRVMDSVRRWLHRRLRLVVNEKKSRVAKLSECEFLGFVIQQGKIKISPSAKTRFENRLRKLTGRNRGISFEVYLSQLNAYLRGWGNYFALAEVWKDWRRWAEWTRRRLRQVLLKQWKTPRNRRRNLVRIGATQWQARMIVSSGKSLWRLSRTKTMNMVLTLRWFDKQGLVRLDNLWWALARLR